MRKIGFILAVALAGVLVVMTVGWWLWGHQDQDEASVAPTATPPTATYIGAESCKSCHAAEYTAWQGSAHQKAMAHATDETVEGDFDYATFVKDGITSTFFRRDGAFFVNTEGPDGKLHDYQVKYTFGFSPLQQYLTEFPDGRVQVLPITWDNRDAADGGQRWYSMYPGEHITSTDPLHWTGINQNWNYMCAECHTTNLKRNYDVKTNSFATSWSGINVECEACHGPGSAHMSWARSDAGHRDKDDGLTVHYGARASWIPDEKTGNATRATPRTDHREIDTCGMCHARRYEFREGMKPGQPLLDTHLVSLLDEGLYYPDGQMHDEVYTYGSFLQSKMYAKGVTCSDCHEPHSQKLRAPGNGVCLQCHAADRYDRTSHHHHTPDTRGAACVACHMPERTYMQIQPRHDHSLRVPRPDLSEALGTPNACNACHLDKSSDWAAKAIANWFGPDRKGLQKYGPALAAAQQELPSAPGLLDRIVGDMTQPAIARGTAYAAYAGYLTPARVKQVARGLDDPEPLVRLGAIRALEGMPPVDRWRLFDKLLHDPVRAVRIRAAANLADVPTGALTPDERTALNAGLDEYVQSLHVNFDRPEARVEYGLYLLKQGDPQKAEQAYRQALELVPNFPQAIINLSDLYRQTGRDAEGEKLLKGAISDDPDFAAAHHALGLLLIRRHQLDDAVRELAQAARLAPGQAQYSYVYAVALEAAGQMSRALHVLEEAHKKHPSDRNILAALASYNRKAGNMAAAGRYTQKLRALQ